jgi:hypothetical protein
MPDGASTTHLYRPKLMTVLEEGYGWSRLIAAILALTGRPVAEEGQGDEPL